MVSASPEPFAGEQQVSVLLVEDNLDTLDMYEIYLNSVGYRVATAHTEADARRIFGQLNPDIVVTDLGLPGRSSGLSFIQHVATRRVRPAVPIIVVTGQDPVAVPHTTTAAVAAIMVKPVLPDALEAEVRRILERSRVLQRRVAAARERVPDLRERTEALLLRSRDAAARAPEALPARHCPSCSSALRWSTTRVVGDTTFDYYERCEAGCGRFFFNRATGVSFRLP